VGILTMGTLCLINDVCATVAFMHCFPFDYHPLASAHGQVQANRGITSVVHSVPSIASTNCNCSATRCLCPVCAQQQASLTNLVWTAAAAPGQHPTMGTT
jgi:hypothetical protein